MLYLYWPRWAKLLLLRIGIALGATFVAALLWLATQADGVGQAAPVVALALLVATVLAGEAAEHRRVMKEPRR